MKSQAAFVAGILLLLIPDCYSSSPALRTDDKCLNGTNHKRYATPEGPDYAACHQFRSKSCCTADFTKKLARATVTNIDNFYWNRCGNLSKRCEEFMIAVECFYRCSPNVVHWEGEFPSSLNRVPVCHQFCDDWYAACRTDESCATDWLTGYNSSADGTNHCRSDSVCQTWEQRYGNSRTMCDVMWGRTFRYTTDTSKCLQVNGSSNLAESNAQAVRRILGGGGSHVVASRLLSAFAVGLAAACTLRF